MQFTVNPQALYGALNQLMPLVSKQPSDPILSHVFIEATDDGVIHLHVTNLTTEFVALVLATVDAAGQLYLPAGLLADLMRRISQDTILLTTDDTKQTATIKYGRSRATLHGIARDAFPSITVDTLPIVITTFDAAQMSTIARQVAFSVAHDETRPALRGIAVTTDPTAFTLAATDGSRLSRLILPTTALLSGEPRTVITPPAIWTMMARIATQSAVTLMLYDQAIVLSTSQFTMTSRLVEGTYPDYSRIFPTTVQFSVVLPRQETIGALERVMLVAQRGRSSVVTWTQSPETTTLQALSQGVGDASESLPVTVASAGETEPAGVLLFNPHFLLEVFRALTSDTIQVAFYGDNAPILVSDPADSHYHHLCLPLRQLTPVSQSA